MLFIFHSIYVPVYIYLVIHAFQYTLSAQKFCVQGTYQQTSENKVQGPGLIKSHESTIICKDRN